MSERKTRKQLLTEHVKAALVKDFKFFAIVVRMEGFPKDEVIINETANFIPKLDYWCKTYDDELVHKHSNTIYIVSCYSANSLEELQKIIY